MSSAARAQTPIYSDDILDESFRTARSLLLVMMKLRQPRTEDILRNILQSPGALMDLISDYSLWLFSATSGTNWEDTLISQTINSDLSEEKLKKQKTIAYFNTARLCSIDNTAMYQLEVIFNKSIDERHLLAGALSETMAVNGHRIPQSVL